MSTSQDMTEQEIWQELVRFTGNKYAAAGIMGNLKAESNLNSKNLQQTYETKLGHTDESYTQAVDSGSYGNFASDSAGYGLAQWTYGSRKQQLLDYAKQTGQSIGSTKMQMSFLEKELTENYASTLNNLKNAKSVQEASNIMLTQFEKPTNQSSSAQNTRTSYGNNYYNQYNSLGAGSGIDLSGTGDPNSSGLSDVTLEVQPDNINDVCSQWQSKILSANLSSIDIAGTFAPLTNAGVGTSYIPSLQTAFAQAESMILSVINTIQNAANEQAGIDENQNQGQQSYGGGYSGGGGGGKRKKSGDATEGVVPAATIPTIDPVEVPSDDQTDADNTDKKVEINTEFVNKISALDSESYIKFMTVLGSIANGNLLELIADENSASDLKKKLLESPNLDADLKKIISEMDENELQVTLQSILTSETAVSDLSKSIIYNYTESLANDTNLTILKVSKEVQFFNQVDELFNTVNTLVTKENLQQNVLSIYDGDGVAELGESSVSFVRSVVDSLSKINNATYEDLLTDKSKEKVVKDAFTDLSKSLSYFRTVNTMGMEASQLLYNNLMKGVK